MCVFLSCPHSPHPKSIYVWLKPEVSKYRRCSPSALIEPLRGYREAHTALRPAGTPAELGSFGPELYPAPSAPKDTLLLRYQKEVHPV